MWQRDSPREGGKDGDLQECSVTGLVREDQVGSKGAQRDRARGGCQGLRGGSPCQEARLGGKQQGRGRRARGGRGGSSNLQVGVVRCSWPREKEGKRGIQTVSTEGGRSGATGRGASWSPGGEMEAVEVREGRREGRGGTGC